MLKVNIEIKGLKELDKQIEYVKNLMRMKTDTNFQKFIQDKVMQTLNKVMEERLSNDTTNNEYIEEYKLHNKIREEEDGFVLYNDFTIPAILTTQNTRNQNRDNGIVRNYSNGFSIALAFEYGVGIVGQENPVEGAWEYNVNNYQDGWYYKDVNGVVLFTQGYKGMQIYKYTKIEVEKNLPKWVNEYCKQVRGVSK
jgi:hypothetical protein